MTDAFARTADPATSHAAAEMVDAKSLDERIVKALMEMPNMEGTMEDVITAIPEVRICSISPRFKRLVEKGRLEVTGEKRLTVTNRYQMVRKVVVK